MTRPPTSIARRLLIATLTALAAGCSTPFTAPEPSDPGATRTGPEMLVIETDGSVRYVAPPDPAAGGSPGPAAVSMSAKIDGSTGGRLTCGRFILAVPAGAYAGVGTITMSMADSTVMVLDVHIDPDSLNAFALPVSVALSTQGAAVDPDSLSIYWWDPQNESWVGMACDTNLEDNPEIQDPQSTTAERGLLTPLEHFSRYGGGKAGW
jgi:hypothetical protein